MWRTENEAKENAACPLIEFNGLKPGKCVGSFCMMWRAHTVASITLGYCGLASAPQQALVEAANERGAGLTPR